jgi:hypothetical protein
MCRTIPTRAAPKEQPATIAAIAKGLSTMGLSCLVVGVSGPRHAATILVGAESKRLTCLFGTLSVTVSRATGRSANAGCPGSPLIWIKSGPVAIGWSHDADRTRSGGHRVPAESWHWTARTRMSGSALRSDKAAVPVSANSGQLKVLGRASNPARAAQTAMVALSRGRRLGDLRDTADKRPRMDASIFVLVLHPRRTKRPNRGLSKNPLGKAPATPLAWECRPVL